MGVIDESKLNDILPKYDELKLSGKNLAQQYVSAFNTGMNIYQCVNQLQGYIEWVIKAVNDVVVQWNETIDSQIKYTISGCVEESVKESVKESVNASKQATTEQFNIEWEKVQHTLETLENNVQHTVETLENEVQHALETFENDVSLIKLGTTDYYVLTESKDKNTKKLDYYFKYVTDYSPTAPSYSNNLFIFGLDLEGYTVKTSLLSNNTCKLKSKSTGDLIDYVYFMLDDNVKVTTTKTEEPAYTQIALKYLPYFAKLKTDTPVAGRLYVDACISIILEKTSS